MKFSPQAPKPNGRGPVISFRSATVCFVARLNVWQPILAARGLSGRPGKLAWRIDFGGRAVCRNCGADNHGCSRLSAGSSEFATGKKPPERRLRAGLPAPRFRQKSLIGENFAALGNRASHTKRFLPSVFSATSVADPKEDAKLPNFPYNLWKFFSVSLCLGGELIFPLEAVSRA